MICARRFFAGGLCAVQDNFFCLKKVTAVLNPSTAAAVPLPLAREVGVDTTS